ncbi:AMP deaminase [Diplonema papillatum]|nr:AMP deaminase [Diplonema papillatum]
MVESDGLPKDTAFAPPSQTVVKMIDGIVTCDEDGVSFMDIPSASQFANDYKTLVGICNNQLTTSFCQRRTSVLLTSFEIHQCMNGVEEKRTTGDFYSCAKVDNHIHMAAGMSSKELLGFIYDKVRSHGDDIVEFKDGRTQTLDEVYRSLGVDINSLTVDDLDVMADSDNLFHRFDRFNEKYNPLGSPALRECFLKTDNFMAGRYFAQLVNHVLDRVEADEVYYTELRLSIYGRANDEWDRLAKWAATNDVTRWCNKWLIQVPRIYHVFKKRQMLENFGQLIDNIFRPLWEVSIDPRSNWALHQLLAQVVGFDSVDNEKLTDLPFSDRSPSPSNWNTDKNPPYVYWLFYMYANIKTLNTYRAQKGLNTFSLRPHCGESGAVEHLAAAFLTADGINHGINLRKSPTLQYLYYLSQIPVSASPLSNNALFLPLSKNPFATFFKSGLNITLSTDDPLQFHLTQEALVEEYSVASKLWKFSTTDLVEIARNSVLMSGFSFQVKSKHLGPLYILSSSNGNQRYRSRLSDTRVAYRYETLVEEHTMLEKLTDSPVPHVFSTKAEEEVVIRRYALHGYLSPAFARNASETQQTTQAPVTRGNQSKPAGMSRVSFMRSPGLPPNVGLSSTYSSGTQLQRVAVGSPMSAVAAKTVRISVQYCDCQRLVLDRSNVPVGLTEDADKKWDTLKTAIEKYCREELGVSNFRILSQERKHLTAWAPCIALDRAVICETRDFSPDSD